MVTAQLMLSFVDNNRYESSPTVGSTIECIKKGKGSPFSITERRFPQLNTVLGSQPATT